MYIYIYVYIFSNDEIGSTTVIHLQGTMSRAAASLLCFPPITPRCSQWHKAQSQAHLGYDLEPSPASQERKVTSHGMHHEQAGFHMPIIKFCS